MKNRIIASAVVFVLCFCFAALVAWLHGYDFCHRSPKVAEAFIMTVFYCVVPAVGVYFWPQE